MSSRELVTDVDVARCLAMMRSSSGLINTPPTLDPLFLSMAFDTFREDGLTTEELRNAARRIVREQKFWPSIKTWRETYMKARGSDYYLVGLEVRGYGGEPVMHCVPVRNGASSEERARAVAEYCQAKGLPAPAGPGLVVYAAPSLGAGIMRALAPRVQNSS